MMSICTVRVNNWEICVKKYFEITKKLFLSERCTSAAYKAATVKFEFFGSGTLRKFGHLFYCGELTRNFFFGFWANQYIFVPNRNMEIQQKVSQELECVRL